MPNVSRETFQQLQVYVDLVAEWQKAINLVSLASLPDIWWRHVVDSGQLYPLFPKGTRTVLDIGSGGGFPAIVLAILSHSAQHFTLVESDRRKAIFLREAARACGLSNVTILTSRIENLPPQNFDLVTARALAPVTQLLDWAKPYSRHFLFPKGEQAPEETASISQGLYKIEYFQSVTDEKARILWIESF